MYQEQSLLKVLWCVVEVWRKKIRWEVFSCAQREKRVKKREEKRREKTFEWQKKFLFSFFFLFSFSGKTKTRDLLCFFARRKKKKKVTQNQRKKKEKKTIKYIPRARRNVKAASSAEKKKTRTRRINKARSSSVLMIGFYIAHLRDFYCARRQNTVTLIFFLFLCSKEEKKFVLSRSLSFSCWKPSKTRGKEKKWKWEKTHQKKYFWKMSRLVRFVKRQYSRSELATGGIYS